MLFLAKCDNTDCGVVLESAANGDAEGPAATGTCKGTKSNYQCKCCKVSIGGVDNVETEHPDDGFGNIDNSTCSCKFKLIPYISL